MSGEPAEARFSLKCDSGRRTKNETSPNDSNAHAVQGPGCRRAFDSARQGSGWSIMTSPLVSVSVVRGRGGTARGSRKTQAYRRGDADIGIPEELPLQMKPASSLQRGLRRSPCSTSNLEIGSYGSA